MFVRVRGALPGDPLHEFDVPVVRVERSPGLFVVVDDVPVLECRPPRYVSAPVSSALVHVPKSSKRRRK